MRLSLKYSPAYLHERAEENRENSSHAVSGQMFQKRIFRICTCVIYSSINIAATGYLYERAEENHENSRHAVSGPTFQNCSFRACRCANHSSIIIAENLKKKLRGLSPRANYTDRTTASIWIKVCVRNYQARKAIKQIIPTLNNYHYIWVTTMLQL
jgi:hypothetical protein